MNTAICKFWEMADNGLSAALDYNEKTGEVVCIYTTSNDSHRYCGLRAAPIPYTSDWTRVIESRNGDITDGEA